MTQEKFEIAGKVVVLLKNGDAAIAELLCDDVVYQNLGLELNGRTDVLMHLLGEKTGRLYRDAEWGTPAAHGDAALIEAQMPSGSSFNDKILLLHFRGDRVRAIQEQLRLPIARPAETALSIGAGLRCMINSALEARNPMLLAYTDESGQPVVSLRGSVQVVEDDRLTLWVRNPQSGLIRAIAVNPKVALMYRNEQRRASFQLQGRARIVDDEAEKRRVFDALPKVERDHDFAALGQAIIIELDRIEGYAGVAEGRVVDAVNMRRIASVARGPD